MKKKLDEGSFWDYRIVKAGGAYTVREVFYTKGKPHSWTIDEISPSGGTRDELRKSFVSYINDITFKPILKVKGDKVVGEEKPLSKLLTIEMLPLKGSTKRK